MKWFGLTGGIATGKSSCKKLLEGLGIPVIDADKLARDVVQPGLPAFNQIVSSFGTLVISSDGLLNRSALADIIFKSTQDKLKLEQIIHPMIQLEVQKLKKQYLEIGTAICFYDVPLLFEKNLQNQFDAVVLIWCDSLTQRARLKARNGLTDQQVSERINSQMPLSEKLPLAKYCLDNSTTIHNLDIQVRSLVEKLKKIS